MAISVKTITLIVMIGINGFAFSSGSTPDSGGSLCYPKAVSGGCKTCPCTNIYQFNIGTNLINQMIAAGISKTPANAPNTGGTLRDGGEGLANGLPSLSTAMQGTFGDVDLMSGLPRITRTDLDWSSNGMFSLHAKRNYLGPRLGHFPQNTTGRTLLGPEWYFTWEMRVLLGYVGANPIGFRDEHGGIVYVTPTGTPNEWRLDPGVAGATLVRTPGTTVTYTLTVDGKDAIYGFASNGTLEYMADRNNNRINFTYNSLDQLSQISASSPDDRYLSLEYFPIPAGETEGSTARLKKITCSWNSRFVEYEYTDDTRLGKLAKVKDTWGRTVESYDYNDDDELDPFGFDVSQEPLGCIPYWLTLKRPNVNGELTTTVVYLLDKNTNHNDSLANVIGEYDGLGNRILWREEGLVKLSNGLAVSVPYDEHMFIPSEVNYYDLNTGSSPVKTFYQSQVANPVSGMATGTGLVSEGYWASDPTRKTEYTYNTAVSPTDPAFGQIYKTKKPGEIAEYTYYNNEGRVSGTWLSNDRNTSYTYDLNGNMKTQTVNGTYTTTYTLDSCGRLESKETPLGISYVVHDIHGHIIQTEDEEGFKTTYTYNLQGLKTARWSRGVTTSYYYDSMDRLTTITNQLGNSTVIAYATNNSIISSTDALGHIIHYHYSPIAGTLTSITDPEGGIISYQYDLFGNKTTLTDQRNKVTTYVYDVFNRLKTETNPLSQTTAYEYDDDGGCSSCGSGGIGSLASITTADGNTTYYEYDDANRLEKVTYSGLTDEVTHTYDQYGQRIATLDNRLPTDDFPTQTFEWEYDNFGRTLKETYPDGKFVSWIYDINGRRLSMTDPDGTTTIYMYSNTATNKKLDYVNNPISGDTYHYYHANNGYPFVTQNYNDSYPYNYRHQDDLYYDELNRLYTIFSSDGTINYPLFQVYRYDAASRIYRRDIGHHDPSIDDLVYDYSRYYAYDDADRLISEQKWLGPWYGLMTLDYKTDYWYDLAGNRTEAYHDDGTTQYTDYFAPNDFNQLSWYMVNGVEYYPQYDARGNQIYLETGYPVLRHHNRDNRMTSNTVIQNDAPSILTDYVYDFSGRLLMKSHNGVKTKTYYDGINNLMLTEKPSGGIWRTKRQYALEDDVIGHVLATREYSYIGTSTLPSGYNDQWYKYDKMGCVTATVDNSGNVSLLDMDVFGNVRIGGVEPGPRLTTKEYDSANELYYFNQRWYDRSLGSWIGVEPSAKNGPNLYRFVKNNPLLYFDYDGLDDTIWTPGPGRSFKDGPRNGNWGGKNWSGGASGGVIGPAAPTDSGDECFKDHDLGYDACDRAYPAGSPAHAACIKAVDKKLEGDLKALPRDPRHWPHPPKPGTEADTSNFRDWAIWYF